MPPLKLSRLENAKDSLTRGIRSVLMAKPDPSDLKTAILSTAHAVGLFLKERLSRTDPSLIFTVPADAGKADAHTVTISESLRRLKRDAKVKIGGKDEKTIIRLSKTRNRIQHNEIEITFEKAINQVNDVIAFLTDFLNSELGIDVKTLLNAEDIYGLLEIGRIANELKRVATDNIAELEREYLPVRLADLADSDFEIMLCPECWEEYYVFSPVNHLSQCQLCKHQGGFVECVRCGRNAPRGSMEFQFEDEWPLCRNCWVDIQAE